MISRYTSIIITTHTNNKMRSQMLRDSLMSLLSTVKKYPVEIIVVDNASLYDDSLWLFSLAGKGFIQSYIYNATNMHFGFARNQGIAVSQGHYIVIADNDIHYNDGWFEACIKPLELYPDKKIYTTPLDYPMDGPKKRYNKGTLDVEGVSYSLNMRAGSNCFMIHRYDLLEEIGIFTYHRVAGTKWTNEAVEKGYLAAVAPGKLVYDLGLRNGYNHKEAIPIRRILTNKEEVLFNQDEYEQTS